MSSLTRVLCVLLQKHTNLVGILKVLSKEFLPAFHHAAPNNEPQHDKGSLDEEAIPILRRDREGGHD